METNYDAIVVGTGISGGWAAKELCEKGLKTLVLERGPMVKHVEDYPTMNNDHWDYKTGDVITQETKKTKGKQMIVCVHLCVVRGVCACTQARVYICVNIVVCG